MARVLMLLLSQVLLFGCVTAGPEGMKRISETPGMKQAALQSIEKMMSVAVMGFGYICPTVTDIYLIDSENLIGTCFDGKTSTNYMYVQSKDEKWYSVTPSEKRLLDSLEDGLQRIIYGQGFKCSKVTDILMIKWEEIFQVNCIEGKYKLVKGQLGGITVSPW